MIKQHLVRSLLLIFGFLLVATNVGFAQDSGHTHGGIRPELERPSPITLDPTLGTEIGSVYQAFLSPQQEGGEEEDTPAFIPAQFRSTEPSVPREERNSRGHAVIEFTNDLSRAYVHLAVSNVDSANVNLLHLHCGRPSQLGPIIVDFGMMGNLSEMLADGVMTLEITNADLEAVIQHGEGLIGAFTAGCITGSPNPTERFTTIGGLEYVARQGELYFNLHTTGQTYFGDIRGAFRPVDMNN